MKTKLKDIVKQNQVYIWAFALPFFIMLFLFIINFIYPFGDQSFLNTDLYHQYLPFLIELQRKLKAGDSLFFSWNLGLGSNFIALYAYYLATPFYWLCVFIPETFLMEFISYLVVLKIALCGLTSCIYLTRHFETKRRAVAIFSLFYALSGYMAAYNWNVMWLDCIVLAPLIILGLELLVKEGKYKLYCLSLGLAILTNYYICIMICIYLVLYFLVVLLPLAKDKLAACVRFALYSLIAGGIGAVLLLPAFMALQLSRASSSDFPTTLESYFPLFDAIGKHFLNVEIKSTPQDFWPNIYCSVAVLILFPLYLLNKKIAFKDKIGNIILLFIMLLSFSYNIPSFIWHGMNQPNGLPARQSFLYILLMLTVCLDAFLHIKEVSKKELQTTYTIVFLFLFLAQKLITDDAFTADTFFITAGFLALYAGFLYLFLNYKELSHSTTYLVVMIFILEAFCNTMFTSVETISRNQYLQNYNTYHALTSTQTENDGNKYYRYEKAERKTNNDSLLHNYPSLSMFSSTNNALVSNFYSRYGMRGLKNYFDPTGMTPFMGALLSCGYTFHNGNLPEEGLYQPITTLDSVRLYKNTYSIPLGFCISPSDYEEEHLIHNTDIVPSIITTYPNDGLLPIERQNILATQLGADRILFSELPCNDIIGQLGFSTIEVTCDTQVYAHFDTTEFFKIDVYANDEKVNTCYLTAGCTTFDLGYYPAGTTLSLQANIDELSFKTEDSTSSEIYDGLLHLTAYSMDEECLTDLVNKLNTNTLSVEEMTSDSLSGTITADKNGYLILSIPYDPGFTIKVDGTETEVSLFEDMMIAVPVTAGDHSISLDYYPQGLHEGIIISLCSLAVFMAICILEQIFKKKKA